METLNYKVLSETGYNGYILKDAPVKVMQFGEGNFLRAFVDYFYDIANEKAGYNGKVKLVQPIGNFPQMADWINEQEGLYTLYLRGSEKGQKVDAKRVISCVSDCVCPYIDGKWDEVLALARSEDLETVVSNTTEAGIAYTQGDSTFDQVPPNSFPAKLTRVLYERYKAFNGAADKLRNSLSRLGGGIGTRGPGEKKLEMDRRLIHARISQLKAELAQVQKHRELIRSKRKKDQMVVAAIVGYTNAGKSTLLNTLTDAGVLEEDKLFATLDPTTRLLELPGGQNILLTDTVGFIRKLPHHLIEAFKSTLEEAKYADIIIHVVDASNPQKEKQMHVVYETLKDLGVKDQPILTLFNKQDRIENPEILKDMKADKTLKISAKTGQGLDDLKDELEKILRARSILLERVFPYEKAGLIQIVRAKGQLLEEEYRGDGIYVKAFVPAEIYGKVAY